MSQSPSMAPPNRAASARRSNEPRKAPHPSILVACPDARPPAYQAAIGLAEAGRLGRFVTAFYYKGHGPISELARRYIPCHFIRIRKVLKRRQDRRIPSSRVRSHPGFDLALALESRIGSRFPSLRRGLARFRTRRFDRQLARRVAQERPGAVLLFSDVGSEFTLPLCRRLGIPTVLSMVTGDVREERRLLEDESRLAPDYFPFYLGNGSIDREAMDFLHERRLAELELADLILVPSRHIAETLIREGIPAGRVRVVPYAADTSRFRPEPVKPRRDGCTFLFAGGIAQRKGIKYLLEAWSMVKRPGWRLQLLGGLPESLGPIGDHMADVEHLGRVGHGEVAAKMAAADVFVFPSLFEGSAVVTYEALACGLPSIVTPNAGSVVRDGVEGFVVPIRDVQALADRMVALGSSPERRAEMSTAARERAMSFDWPLYHSSVVEAAESVMRHRRED